MKENKVITQTAIRRSGSEPREFYNNMAGLLLFRLVFPCRYSSFMLGIKLTSKFSYGKHVNNSKWSQNFYCLLFLHWPYHQRWKSSNLEHLKSDLSLRKSMSKLYGNCRYFWQIEIGLWTLLKWRQLYSSLSF